MDTNKVGIRSFRRPGGASTYFQTDKMPNSLDPSASVPRTRASSATPSTPPTTGGARKPSLPAELTSDILARQEIFNRISTSSVIYGSRPEIPAKPSFTRLSSMRNSQDTSETQEVDTRESTRESLEESVSFSELDETDSVVETQSVKDSIIEENEEEEEEEEVNQWQAAPPSAPNFRLGRLGDKDERLKTANNDRQQATNVLQKTNTPETETRDLPPDTAKILAAVETKHHTEPRVPRGIVGFASLPDQVYRRSLRKGFEFSLMVVGESGLGKSTLVNSMFMTDIYSSKESEVSPSVAKTVRVETHSVVLQEGGVKLSLNVVDTPGFGDGVDNTGCWEPITEYVDEQFNSFLEAESRVNRVSIPDNRVHVCLYFLAPTGHGLRAVDVEFMKRLHFKVNIIPVIGKSDTCTREELAAFKVRIREQLTEHQINVYNFPGVEEGGEEANLVPFAVVGSNTVLKDDHGKKVRGRRYPWGTVNIEDKSHCDFVSLRHLVLAKHMQDLKDLTSQCHYEKYRCEKLTSMALNKEGTTLLKNPLALIEDEKLAHNGKMRKMKGDMEEVFLKKVEEKEGRLRRLEQDEEARLERERRGVEDERASIVARREDLEREKKTWAANNGIEMSKFLGRSTESLDSKRKKYTLPNNPFRFGRS